MTVSRKAGEIRGHDFIHVAEAALPLIEAILNRYGVPFRRAGAEIEMLNTRRADRQFGSFRINRRTGRWADFAAGEAGGDVISLCAYLEGKKQIEAMRDLAQIVGVNADA